MKPLRKPLAVLALTAACAGAIPTPRIHPPAGSQRWNHFLIRDTQGGLDCPVQGLVRPALPDSAAGEVRATQGMASIL